MNYQRIKNSAERGGQALVSLLVFMVIGIAIAGAAITVSIINSQATAGYLAGEQALSAADSGIENALIQLLRNHAYAGETLTLGGANAIITVSAVGNSFTVLSEGISQNIRRKVQATASLTGTILTVNAWTEVD